MIKHLIFSLLLTALVFAAIPARAQPRYTPIPNTQYKDIVTGNTIKGEYRFMRQRTKTYNFTEHHNADGTTLYKEGAIEAKGIWFTLGTNKVCYKYAKGSPMGNATSCFWIYESKSCYYGYGLPYMGINGPRNFDDWTARWVIKGSGGSCSAPIG